VLRASCRAACFSSISCRVRLNSSSSWRASSSFAADSAARRSSSACASAASRSYITHTHTYAKFNLTGRPGICVAMRVLLHPLLQLLQPNAQAPPVHSPPHAPTSHTQTQMPSLISLPGQYGASHLSGDVSTSSSFAAASAAQCSSSACVSAASRCCKQPYMMGTVTEYHALQGP